MFEKDWQKALGGIFLGVILFILLGRLGVTSGFLRFLIAGILILSIFNEKFGRAAKTVRTILVLAALLVFLFSWSYSKATALWAKHKLQENAPRDTFNPETEAPKVGEKDSGALAKFMRRPDGVIEKVPVEWRRNKYNSLQLAEPGSREYWELLNEYEVQEAQRRLQKETKGNSPSVPAIVQLTPENPVGAFKAGPGQQTAEYTYPVNWSPSDFEVVITEGTGTLVINHKYRVEGVVPGDKRLDDLRGVGIVPTFESIVSYQIVGGPITGLVKTSW